MFPQSGPEWQTPWDHNYPLLYDPVTFLLAVADSCVTVVWRICSSCVMFHPWINSRWLLAALFWNLVVQKPLLIARGETLNQLQRLGLILLLVELWENSFPAFRWNYTCWSSSTCNLRWSKPLTLRAHLMGRSENEPTTTTTGNSNILHFIKLSTFAEQLEHCRVFGVLRVRDAHYKRYRTWTVFLALVREFCCSRAALTAGLSPERGKTGQHQGNHGCFSS